MARVIGFIDGFNLYHALKYRDDDGNEPYAKYRWLDYKKLIECYLSEGDTLEAVYYFTAYVSWDSASGRAMKERHKKFVAVQRDKDVNVVLGRFRPVKKKCHAVCKKKYQTYEEKRTDVNIAVTMLKLAVQGRYDKAILISGDSDMIPALEAIKEVAPAVKVTTVVPIKQRGIALMNASDFVRHMRESHLKRCLLPHTVTLKNGSVIECPEEWR